MSQYVNSQLIFTEVLKKEFSIDIRPRQKISCINPDHRDSDASLLFYSDDAGSFCFGCGRAYFPLDIIMFKRDVNYYKALEIAQAEYNCELPQKGQENQVESNEAIEKYKTLQGMRMANKKALNNYCVVLKAIEDENYKVYEDYKRMKGMS